MKKTEQTVPSMPAMRRRFPLLAAGFLIVVVFGCSIYANLSFTVVIHDSGIVMMALTLVIASFCWLNPLGRLKRVPGWGLVRGLVALIKPILVRGLLSYVLSAFFASAP